MYFLLYFVLTILALFVVVWLMFKIVKSKLQNTIGVDNFNELIDAVKMTKELEIDEYSRPKDVSGMTKLLEPIILRDFPDFNKDLLFRKVEQNLGDIFNSIKEKSIISSGEEKDLVLVENKLQKTIEDLKERKEDISYEGVQFHAHAIKAYDKKEGMAKITTSSTVEYYFRSNQKNNTHQNVKKQTRYTCEFIYVFDASKVDANVATLVIRCPNCGAPLKGLGKVHCTYCGSDVEPINLKAWKMVGYKEDY